MYVIHTRLTKVAKLASLVITVFTELGKSRSVTSLTHAHNWGVSKNSACPVVTKKRVSRKTPTVKRADEKKIKCNFSLYPAYERERVRVSFIEYKQNK